MYMFCTFYDYVTSVGNYYFLKFRQLSVDPRTVEERLGSRRSEPPNRTSACASQASGTDNQLNTVSGLLKPAYKL